MKILYAITVLNAEVSFAAASFIHITQIRTLSLDKLATPAPEFTSLCHDSVANIVKKCILFVNSDKRMPDI
jgi:hypothetical protein